MNPADSLMQLGQHARAIQMVATNKKAHRFASEAVKHATAGLMAHNTGGDAGGIQQHIEAARNHLRNAAQIHIGTLSEDENPTPAVLDHAHLGAGQELHEDYADAVNEGKKNGR